MTIRRRLRWLLGLTVLSPSSHLHACTVCDSQAGHQLRSQLFNGHFLRTFACIGLPWGVVVLAALTLYFAVPDFQSPVANEGENLDQTRLTLVPGTARTSS
jgi:hypothetical protein